MSDAFKPIRIISDGARTRVVDHNGKALPGIIERIEIDPITSANANFVTAKITFANVAIDICANAPIYPE